jgi:hypothetical protein
LRREDFQFGEIRSAGSGNKFTVWVKADSKSVFDGIEVKSEPTILVYDTAKPNESPVAIRMQPHGTHWDSALSPRGAKLALFDGQTVQIFSLAP